MVQPIPIPPGKPGIQGLPTDRLFRWWTEVDRASFRWRLSHIDARPGIEITGPVRLPVSGMARYSKHYYELKRCAEFADLEGRVVIDWGSGALAWHQHLTNKPVIELFPKGRVLEPIHGLSGFLTLIPRTERLMSTAHAHRDWMTSLSVVAGVYLILAQSTGRQYVGSAYGLEGIWGRWSQYAATGHGGNSKLRALLKADSAYPNSFRFSILQVLPKTTAVEEVIRKRIHLVEQGLELEQLD